jgi:IS605 OrfB family transposase
MSNDTAENVLILQGGGSLGALGCGVFKALASNNIKIDIVAGTSIGGLNATIIAGSKGDHPERELEQFWLELAERSMNLKLPASTRISQAKSILSCYGSAFHGNKKVMHKITRGIVNRAIETDSLIVLGKLKGLRNQEKKKGRRRGRKFNRKISGFPHFKFTEYLTYKAALAGVKVIKIFENWTSQTCRRC